LFFFLLQSNSLFCLCLFHQEWKEAELPHPQAKPAKNGVFGINCLNNEMLQDTATLCGFKDPEKNTAHSKRKHTIASPVSTKEKIGHQNIMTAALHKSEDTHDLHQGSAPALHDRCFCALFNPAGSNNVKEDNNARGECLFDEL
jgi:hypothetical protein